MRLGGPTYYEPRYIVVRYIRAAPRAVKGWPGRLQSAAMSTRLWDRAALVPVDAAGRFPEIVALPATLPTVAELFTFMRDAELRFRTLRMRIDEREIYWLSRKDPRR